MGAVGSKEKAGGLVCSRINHRTEQTVDDRGRAPGLAEAGLTSDVLSQFCLES